jgi:hypothetical protein
MNGSTYKDKGQVGGNKEYISNLITQLLSDINIILKCPYFFIKCSEYQNRGRQASIEADVTMPD